MAMSDIATFENERATNYDSFVQTWIPNYQFFIELIPRLFKEVINENLLVVGCGTGNEIAAFKHSNPNWSITGVDPSPQMLSQARDKLKAYPGITLLDGVVSDLPDQRMYGAATLLLVLHFIKDDGSKLNLLLEIAKRLKAGSPLVILDITGDKQQIKNNLELLRYTIPEGLDTEQIELRMKRIQEDLEHVSEQRVIELLEQAGFEKPIRFFQSTIYLGWITTRRS